MKKITLVLLFIGVIASSQAQSKNDSAKRVADIEDRMALKELVDKFSILSDQKDVQSQALLFTEDAVVSTYFGDKLTLSLNGRKQIGEVFGNFLNTQEIVYHINGQQTVKINGDKATGISYCQVTLVAIENGKRTMTMQGVYYDDEYVRMDGKWLIAKRTSHFVWRDCKVVDNK